MRASRLAAAAALTVAALGALGAAAPAPARAQTPPPAGWQDSPYMPDESSATPQKEYGNSQNYTTFFDHCVQLHLSWAYVFVTWSDIETSPGVYDLSQLDGMIESAHDHGIHLMMQVQTMGDWVVPGTVQMQEKGPRRVNSANGPFVEAWPYAAPGQNLDATIPFWKALVSRYAPSGTLAAQLGWTDGYGVSYYEVENEPDFFPWVDGNWQYFAKDYALYVSHLKAAVSAIDSSVRLVGPAISSGPDPNPPNGQGTLFLDNVLSTDPATLPYGSDQYRADVAAGAPIVGAGPYLDVYSFHQDLADPTTTYVHDRAVAVRHEVSRFSTQATYPSNASAPIWSSEGSANEYSGSTSNSTAYAWAEEQFALEDFAAGVVRMNWDLGTDGQNNGVDITADAIGKATLAMTSYFPSGQGVSDFSASMSQTAGQTVAAYQWTNPATNLRSLALWAQDFPQGSGSSAPPFTVNVPVSSPYATVVASDWTAQTVAVSNGTVPVQISRGDPSPVVMVVEQSSATPSAPAKLTASRLRPASTGAATTTAAGTPSTRAAGADGALPLLLGTAGLLCMLRTARRRSGGARA